ncbi:MAG: dihydropteroate synthase [Verrucomicrobiales bacterium]|nr:dihydropteroate synthase [Verrucomicrobiales bacterium]
MNAELWSRPRIMGIVNINDDSFSGDGTLDVGEALERAGQMIADGADIIDIGAESARTNREAITISEEIDRLLPFIEKWDKLREKSKTACETQITPALLSVNSWRPEVIEAVLQTGKIDLVNDIGGLPGPANAELCARHDATLLIMHTVGQPKVPHFDQKYRDVWQEMELFFDEKIALARKSGLRDEQIILDPGIDFAKQCDDNLRIYREIERLHRYKLPILLPVSRKTVIGDVLDLPDPADRDAGTIACISRGIRAGVQVFRVHNVKAAADTTRVLHAIHSAGLNSLIREIQTHLNDTEMSTKFFQFLDRSGEVDLPAFIAHVDDSVYSLRDWTEAFLGFDEWLTKQLISGRCFSKMLGYLHCCEMMIASGVEHPEFQTVVIQCLTDYGFDPEQASQA